MKKKIIIVIIAILIVVIGYYIRSLIIKAREDSKKSAQDKYIESMREKYKNVDSVDGFLEGIKYAKHPIHAGYDLRLVKRKQLLLITLDELKDIYDLSKVGSFKDEDFNRFLKIIHKIY